MSVDLPKFVLPETVVSPADLARMVREIESVEGNLTAQKAKKTEPKMPPISQTLDDFLAANKIDITDNKQRMELKKQLRTFKDKAPVMHLTFPGEPDGQSLGKMITWIREELNPSALVSIGLQPSLLGGVYVRTPNHVHDFSLRQRLSSTSNILATKIGEAIK